MNDHGHREIEPVWMGWVRSGSTTWAALPPSSRTRRTIWARSYGVVRVFLWRIIRAGLLLLQPSHTAVSGLPP